MRAPWRWLSQCVVATSMVCAWLPCAAQDAKAPAGQAPKEKAAPGKEIGKADDADAGAEAAEKLPPALKEYLGREIAPYMSYQGADWLIRESREREEACTKLLKILDVKPGANICDMGCGNGFYTLKLAELTAGKGKVYAVDIQPEMLTLLRERAKKANVTNIEPVLGTLIDPKLPDNSIDLMLLVDVYHEFSHPEHMLRSMRKSLTKEGKIVLVEFRAEDPNVPIKPLHKMTKEQIMKELPANGYKLVDQYDKLPWQHVMFFQRDEKWKEPKP